jgi:LysM domain
MSDHLHKIQKLTQALFISGACNILLASAFFYWWTNERPPTPYFEQKPAKEKEQQAPLAIDKSNAEIIRSFRTMPQEQLIAKLASAEMVENGYTQRDLAFACLVQFHEFDLARALAGCTVPEKRILTYGRHREGTLAEITVYPALNDAHFLAITTFAHTEKWPLTGRGLFSKVRVQLNKSRQPDPALIDAFYLTPEFSAAEMLFTRSEASVEKSELLALVAEGNWDLLFTFAEQQRAVQDLSAARRQSFLLKYIEAGSKTAAYLILKTDFLFAARKLNDLTVLKMLSLLLDKTREAERFSLVQLMSPRSEAVQRIAAQRLYDYAGETPPEKCPHHAALQRFVQANTLSAIAQPAAPIIIPPIKPKLVNKIAPSKQNKLPTIRYYIIQEGDSLWKISRLYKADIDKIKKINGLESDFLKPGTALKIPVD